MNCSISRITDENACKNILSATHHEITALGPCSFGGYRGTLYTIGGFPNPCIVDVLANNSNIGTCPTDVLAVVGMVVGAGVGTLCLGGGILCAGAAVALTFFSRQNKDVTVINDKNNNDEQNKVSEDTRLTMTY
jgi:hypothetical protein